MKNQYKGKPSIVSAGGRKCCDPGRKHLRFEIHQCYSARMGKITGSTRSDFCGQRKNTGTTVSSMMRETSDYLSMWRRFQALRLLHRLLNDMNIQMKACGRDSGD